MSPLLPPPRMPRRSAPSRSFLLRPDGPAGAPPGQRLRSGALIGLRRTGSRNKIRITKSPRFEGNPASPDTWSLATLRRKGSEPIQLGGTAGTAGYCAQDAKPYV